MLSDSPTALQVEVIDPARRRDRREFVALPFRLAADHPSWHPGLRRMADELVDPARNPFWERRPAAFFVARRGAEIVGRMAVLDPGAWPDDPQAAVLAFPDFEEDASVLAALLDAVERHARARGASVLLGPFNPDIHHDVGVLVRGHGLPNAVFMGYQPRYYARFFEDAGFRPLADFDAWWAEGSAFRGSSRLEELARRVERQPRLRLRPLDLKNFRKELRLFHDIYSRSFAEHWGFTPPTWEEFSFIAGDLKLVLRERMGCVAEWSGEPVGFALGVPNFHEVLPTDTGGRLTPGLAARTLLRWKRIRAARVMIAGVLPGYRRRGVHLPLFLRVGASILDCGFAGAEVSWVHADNEPMVRALELLGATRVKTYRTYRKELHQ